jgi:pyridoxamine 5'-phosphate oxidase
MKRNIEDIRKDYNKDILDEKDLDLNPILQFKEWFENALNSDVKEANALVLSTVSRQGFPNARVVLLKGLESNGFRFFTNYNSAKGRDLNECPKASMTFFWPELEQQIRINGHVEKLSGKDSDAYFDSRPHGSKISALASSQSSKVNHRDELTDEVLRLEKLYEHQEIERPEHWGGYLLIPNKIEFWQGRASRLHDRFLYEDVEGQWKLSRLAP